MQDIMHYHLIAEVDKNTLAHELKKAGLYNLGQLILSLYDEIETRNGEIQELEETQCSEHCNSEDSVAAFLEKWQDFSDEKIKCKTINSKEFIIALASDVELLKAHFHSYFD